MKTNLSKKYFPILFCIICSIICITIASRNSFLYFTNTAPDIHCFITTSKCMLRGDVLYKEVYEHKGPVLYFIYCIALMLSGHSLAGIYFIECISFSAFGIINYKISEFFIKRTELKYLATALTLLFTATSRSFSEGGQCEEFMLPIISLTLLLSLRHFRHTYPEKFKSSHVIIIGISCALIFWMKYTVTGFYIGLILFIIITEIKEKRLINLLQYSILFIIGFGIGSAPVIIYFAVHNAFYSLYKVYFYNLIVVYGQKANSLYNYSDNIVKVLKENWFLMALIIVTMYSKKIKRTEKTIFFFIFIFAFAGICKGYSWCYASLPFYCFFVFFISILLNTITDKCESDENPSPLLSIKNFIIKAINSNLSNIAAPTALILFLIFDYSFLKASVYAFIIIAVINILHFKKHSSILYFVKYFILTTVTAFICIVYYNNLFMLLDPKFFTALGIISVIYDVHKNYTPLKAKITEQFKTWTKEYQSNRNVIRIAAAVFSVFILSFSVKTMSANTVELMKPAEEFPHYKISEIINKSNNSDPVILMSDCLDQGLYWLTDNYPPEKYFCGYNIKLKDIDDIIEDYTENRKADYIITIEETKLKNYKLIYKEDYTNPSTQKPHLLCLYIPE